MPRDHYYDLFSFGRTIYIGVSLEDRKLKLRHRSDKHGEERRPVSYHI